MRAIIRAGYDRLAPRPLRCEQGFRLPTIYAIYDFLVAAPPYYGSNDTREILLAGLPPLICDQRYARAMMRAVCDFLVSIPQRASWGTGELRCAGSMMRGSYDFPEAFPVMRGRTHATCDGGNPWLPRPRPFDMGATIQRGRGGPELG